VRICGLQLRKSKLVWYKEKQQYDDLPITANERLNGHHGYLRRYQTSNGICKVTAIFKQTVRPRRITVCQISSKSVVPL